MFQSACLFVVLLLSRWVSGLYPAAHNVSWKSTNFKTQLTWEPLPSAEYSYSVEFSQLGKNKERTHHCTRFSLAACDLTASLADLNACYTADVLSEPPLGATSDLTEFPHTSSPTFCPYKDTDIGKPNFKIEVGRNKKAITLNVADQLTALFEGDHQLTIREVFAEQLQYRVTYRKNKSSGKKVLDHKSSVIEVLGLDPGESYCFSVQAYLPSRKVKQLGEMSETKCSKYEDSSIIKDYSPSVIAGVLFFIVMVTSTLIAATVICCKRRRKALQAGRKPVPQLRV